MIVKPFIAANWAIALDTNYTVNLYGLDFMCLSFWRWEKMKLTLNYRNYYPFRICETTVKPIPLLGIVTTTHTIDITTWEVKQVSRIWASLSWLKFKTVAWFQTQVTFRHDLGCLKNWHSAWKWSKLTKKIIICQSKSVTQTVERQKTSLDTVKLGC